MKKKAVDLSVGGYLDLSSTKITALPDNIKINKALILRNSSITKLPDNLTVGGYLDLTGTKITTLPDISGVDGNIFIPDGMTPDGNKNNINKK